MFAQTCRDVSEIEKMVAVIKDRFGSIDILVNNAVMRHFSLVEEFKAEDWNDSIAVNLSAAFHLSRLPMSAALHTYLAGDEPCMSIFNLPGLSENIDDYQKVRDAFWAEDVARIWDEFWNAKVFAEGAWCNTRLFSKTPIHSIEDLKGKGFASTTRNLQA